MRAFLSSPTERARYHSTSWIKPFPNASPLITFFLFHGAPSVDGRSSLRISIIWKSHRSSAHHATQSPNRFPTKSITTAAMVLRKPILPIILAASVIRSFLASSEWMSGYRRLWSEPGSLHEFQNNHISPILCGASNLSLLETSKMSLQYAAKINVSSD